MTSPKSITPAAFAANVEQEIFRYVFAGEDHRWRLYRDQHGRVAQQIVEVIEKFLRKPEPRMTEDAESAPVARPLPAYV